MQTSDKRLPPNRVGEDRTGFSGARLRERRLALGLSLKQLAARTNLNASFLSLVERGRNTPSLESLHRIAKALDVARFTFSPPQNEGSPVVRRQGRVKLIFPAGDAIYFCGQKLREIRAEGEDEAVFLSAVMPPVI